MNRIALIATLLLVQTACLVRAAELSATDSLLSRLAPITRMQGQFVQRQYDDSENMLAESTGRFRLLRPEFFSWEIQSPDRQLIVANAEYLWHYDMDLETATRRPVAGNIEASPLQVLAGDESALRRDYTVEQTAADSFTLTPLGAEQGFRRLGVTFDGDIIRHMDIIDKLGQRVVVDFSDVDTDAPLEAADFQFTPPPDGVDLFYYDQ